MPDPLSGSPRKLPGLGNDRQIQNSVQAGVVGLALQQGEAASVSSASACSSDASSEHWPTQRLQGTALHQQAAESGSPQELVSGPTLLSPGSSTAFAKRPSDASQLGIKDKIVDFKMYHMRFSPVPEDFANVLTNQTNLRPCVSALEAAGLEVVLSSGCVVLVEPYQYAAVQGFSSEAVLGPADVVISGKFRRLLDKNLQSIRGLGFMECSEVPWASANYRPTSTERTGQSAGGWLSKLASRLKSVIIRTIVFIILCGLLALLVYQAVSILGTANAT